MSDQVIPLTVSPNQSFSVQLTVDGNPLTLNLSLSYQTMAGYWTMQIADVNQNVLVASVPLITGWYPDANLLAQYQYLEIGSAYLLNTGNATTDYPGPSNLGLFSLLWGDSS